jgi:coenzyme F420-reducing hydrogenase gamma subunit
VDVSAAAQRHIDSPPELAVHAQAACVHADPAKVRALAALGRQRGPDDRRVPTRIERYVELDLTLSGCPPAKTVHASQLAARRHATHEDAALCI